MNHAAALAAARRQLARSPGAVAAVGGGPPVDLPREQGDPPRVERAQALESVDAPRIVPERASGTVSAFLDGVQRTERVGFAGALGTVPVLFASCAAVILARDADGVLHQWGGGPVRRDALLAPLSLLLPEQSDALRAGGFEVMDTSDDGATAPAHPLSLERAALDRVRGVRAQLERGLADRWRDVGAGWLWVDGPLPGDDASRDARLLGVIKSHRTLYAPGDSLGALFALRAGERSAVVALEATTRVRVASWYLRLRDPGGHGPLHGLVRIEAAITDAPVGARADALSALVLAERQPLARPDPRWDVLAYPVRAAEQVLKAVL